MKKQHPSNDDKQKKPQAPTHKPGTSPPDRDLTDDKQESSYSAQNAAEGPHKKPYEQQHQGMDQNVIPDQAGRIPDETREEVEEKSKNIKP